MRSTVTPPAVRHTSGRVLTVTSVSTAAGAVTARKTAGTAAMKRTVPQLVSAYGLFVWSACIVNFLLWLVFIFKKMIKHSLNSKTRVGRKGV